MNNNVRVGLRERKRCYYADFSRVFEFWNKDILSLASLKATVRDCSLFFPFLWRMK